MEDGNKNIVLVGMMGAGKSYIGNKLAKLLVHFTYVDIDEEIEKMQSMSIPEIFEKYSEEYFRNLESERINHYSNMQNYIISTGGGAFENKQNVEALKKNGITFYLKASSKELFSRIQSEKGEQGRPLLKNDFSQESIQKILKKREKNYMQADFVIDTDKKRAYTILDDILKEYENNVR